MNIILVVCYAICGLYLVMNLKHDIHMLQQNSYRVDRYWRWLKNNMMETSRLIDIALLFLICSTLLHHTISTIIIVLVLIFKIIRIFTAKYKKPLVFTERVWRLYITSVLIVIAMYATLVSIYFNNPIMPIGFMLMISILSWAFAILGIGIMSPVEKAINKKYYNEASEILKSMHDLKIVGITGSFGKTSTKHYLHRILSEYYDVLMTPGSYNTPMGVIRTIREMMKPYNQVFICEMGAKQIGDIKEICDLVNPQIGIVTAVGKMHLESFKSIENVQKTKFELVDALPTDGLAIINNDFEYCANRRIDNVIALRYAVSNTENADYFATNVNYSPSGTKFSVIGPNNFRIDLETQLIGECNISNLVAAVIVAVKLDVPVDKIKYAVGRIEQVEHRLNLKRTPGGVNIIDDAFNSNPTGSRMAVDVLSQFTTGKRIIVTPGMIELGDEQYELNKQLGKYIGEKLDIAIVVGSYNRDAILEGIKESEFNQDNMYIVNSFTEAQTLLSKIMTNGDTVLYENDLPDTFK